MFARFEHRPSRSSKRAARFSQPEGLASHPLTQLIGFLLSGCAGTHAPGTSAVAETMAWHYNGIVPNPEIRLRQGDRLRGRSRDRLGRRDHRSLAWGAHPMNGGPHHSRTPGRRHDACLPRRPKARKEKLMSTPLRALILTSILSAITPALAGEKDVTLYKNPEGDCCEGYADYLRHNAGSTWLPSQRTNLLK